MIILGCKQVLAVEIQSFSVAVNIKNINLILSLANPYLKLAFFNQK